MARRMAKTIQKLDCITQILREDNGLRASFIAARLPADVLGVDKPWDDYWTPERKSSLGYLLYPFLTMLERDGLVFGLRNGNAAAMWFLVVEHTNVQVPVALVEQIESIKLPY